LNFSNSGLFKSASAGEARRALLEAKPKKNLRRLIETDGQRAVCEPLFVFTTYHRVDSLPMPKKLIVAPALMCGLEYAAQILPAVVTKR
jgi:hypothetical protein